jgi:hypothetical protein
VHSAAQVPQSAKIGSDGATTVRVYNDRGELMRERSVSKQTSIVVPPGGFAIAER